MQVRARRWASSPWQCENQGLRTLSGHAGWLWVPTFARHAEIWLQQYRQGCALGSDSIARHGFGSGSGALPGMGSVRVLTVPGRASLFWVSMVPGAMAFRFGFDSTRHGCDIQMAGEMCQGWMAHGPVIITGYLPLSRTAYTLHTFVRPLLCTLLSCLHFWANALCVCLLWVQTILAVTARLPTASAAS